MTVQTPNILVSIKLQLILVQLYRESETSMKFLILLAIVALCLCTVKGQECPFGQRLRYGPTMNCDKTVCRGIEAPCDEAAAAMTVQRCFCIDINQGMDGGQCVSQCPLYPAAPPPAIE